MSDKSINKLNVIQGHIESLSLSNSIKPEVVCVSKTFSIEHIKPLIDHGHKHFGENKVQEAEKKWNEIRKIKKELKLHMVGKLQTNKAKKAVEVFDFIHSLDSSKFCLLYTSDAADE